MIIADTNLVSEPLKSRPDAGVVNWLRDHDGELAITSITVQELVAGAALLPVGRKRRELESAHQALISAYKPILHYDSDAAIEAGKILAELQLIGWNLRGPEDAQIAGIAKTLKFPVATRNTKDFEAMGVTTINPWGASRTD